LPTIKELYAPEQVWLFGSYAYGHPDQWSDLDVLVVSKKFARGNRLARRSKFLVKTGIWRNGELVVDPLCYTPAEFARAPSAVYHRRSGGDGHQTHLSFKTEEGIAMYHFLVVIEKTKHNYSAYSPDLPGCVATGKPRAQTATHMHRAIALHVRGLRADKLPIPQSQSFSEYVAVAV